MKKLLIALAMFAGLTAHAWEQRQPLPVNECKIHSPHGLADTKKVLNYIRQI